MTKRCYKVLKTKQGEFGLIAVLALLFGTIVFVSAQVLNSTDNSSVNITLNYTLVNISLINESVTGNITSINETANLTIPIENGTLPNQSTIINETINLTTPLENASINQSINLTINETINLTQAKKLKNISEIIEKNKNKLNNETESYLKNIKDKKEVKGYIIKFRSSVYENKLVNFTLEKKIDKFKVTKIRGKVENIEDLIEDNEIEFLELEQDVKVLGDSIPFNIKKVKADSAWNSSKGSNVKVAVLDTGIGAHNDLAVAGGVSFVDNNYFDSNGHGTSVAGVIAALLNDEGLAGVSPSVDLYSVKIMQGSTGDLSNAIAGIEWAINNSIDIVSMSFGFNSYSQIFKEVLQEAYNNNILLIAASGNNGQDNILYPAKYDTVIAVGATNAYDSLASFSSYGFEQELVAPGVDINSTSLGNGYGVLSGTSLAAPHVAGIAALIKAYNNSLTNEQIRAKLRNDALDLGQAGKDDFYGYGLVQVNFSTTNFTIINLSYFYEIFNITDFGFLNQSYWFWLNGTGTIDDVDFLPGYYLVNITFDDGKKRSEEYMVSENGIIYSLSHVFNFSDSYTINCPSGTNCATDAVAWVDGPLSVRINPNAGDTKKAECIDFNVSLGVPIFKNDKCYGFQSDIDDCKNNNNIFYSNCNETQPQCTSAGNDLEYHSMPTTTSKGDDVDGAYCYTGNQFQGLSQATYKICYKRQFICTSSTQYQDKCFISTGSPTEHIFATYTCSSGTFCDNTADESSADFGTDGNTMPTSPCKQQCSGYANIGIQNNNERNFTGYYVNVNSALNGTTNAGGTYQINFNNIGCGSSQTIDVYCRTNQSKLCESKTASIDFTGDNDSLVFNCNKCSNNKNLEISLSDIDYKQISGNTYQFNITINNENAEGTFNVTIKGQSKLTGLIISEEDSITTITNSSKDTHNVLISIDSSNVDYFHVYVDTQDQIKEAEEKDNYVIVPFVKIKPKAYLVVNTGNSKADDAIKGYLKLFVQEVTEANATLIIAVGNPYFNSKVDSLNDYTRRNFRWYYDKTDYIPYLSLKKPVSKQPLAYTGLVGGFVYNNKVHIFAYGKNVEGNVAAVKELISAKNLFFNYDSYARWDLERIAPPRVVALDENSRTGLAVMDIMHNKENQPYYNDKTGSDGNKFKDIIEKILTDNNFEIAIKTVQTTSGTSYGQNTTLRLKSLNSDHSLNFKDAVLNNTKPVVMSGGIFSDLFTFEDGLGGDLVKQGYDVWTVEMNGGENTECATCPDYTYQDQVDYYWPALVSGVMRYSNKNQINYIGHSNGCRVALSSLNSYSNGKNNAGYTFNTQTGLYDTLVDLPTHPVDKFFGIACPGTLDDSTTLLDLTDQFIDNPFFVGFNGNYAMKRLNQSGKSHIENFDYLSKLLVWGKRSIIVDLYAITSSKSLLFDEEKISRNLMQFYNDLTIYNNTINFSNISVNKIYLFNGKPSDFLVSFNDQNRILDAVQVNKKGFNYTGPKPGSTDHASIKNYRIVKNDIRGGLNE